MRNGCLYRFLRVVPGAGFWLLAGWGAVAAEAPVVEQPPRAPWETPGLSIEDLLGEEGTLVTLETIIPLTYHYNQRIAAALHDMHAREIAYLHFERNLSQFTPLLADGRVTRDEITYLDSRGHRRRDREYYARSRVGMRKETFDGKTFSAGMGYLQGLGEGDYEANPFVDGEIRLPLLGSYTSLNRITARSFEENELYDARLDYIERVRETIQYAQEVFFWLQRRRDERDTTQGVIEQLREVLDWPRAQQNPADRNQIIDAIQNYQSQLVQTNGLINSMRVQLLDQIGLSVLPLEEIADYNLYAEDYYGSSYLAGPVEQLIVEALENDAEIRVLANARQNSELKRELAARGKWDIFGSLFGRYDFERDGDPALPRGYEVGVGLNMRLIDPKLLRLADQRAEAEVKKYEALIERRRQQVYNLIDRKYAQAASYREQSQELQASLVLRRNVFDQKMRDYADGVDTIDNLLQARTNQYRTQLDLVNVLTDFFEIITELDELTGYYFRQLGLEMDSLNGF